MIEFLTLFVGLTIGIRNVEVTVSGPVTRVELRLDDEVVAELGGPPWTDRCDFGHAPRPASFEAVAFDASGEELARARQWLNLPGNGAEAEIVAIRDPDGRVTAARLAWSSPEFERPREVRVELDGRRLKVDPTARIELTRIPERRVHVLSAEFEFASDVVVRRELVFGREFQGVLDSGLTAITVTLEDFDELPEPRAMAGWFVSGGTELEVAAVERPEARVVVVRDPTVLHRLTEMAPEIQRLRKKERRRGGTVPDGFDDDTGIFVLSPEPVRPDGRSPSTVLFPFSKRPVPGPAGLLEAAVGKAPASLLGGPLMMADAVAVAGLRAAEGNGRRAVILLLGRRREDGSRFSPEVARGYLRDLRVPLVVWDLSGAAADPPTGWGDTQPVDNVDDLVRRIRRVRTRLDQQRVVWLRGRHLPQSIGLAPRAAGVRMSS